jgi:hypothetical protein
LVPTGPVVALYPSGRKGADSGASAATAVQATQSGCCSAVCHCACCFVYDILAPLTIDFLTWLAAEPRDYIDVMDAWRTSCPRLTIWEDAIDAGLVTRVHISGRPIRIELTQRGEALLAALSRVNIGFHINRRNVAQAATASTAPQAQLPQFDRKGVALSVH